MHPGRMPCGALLVLLVALPAGALELPEGLHARVAFGLCRDFGEGELPVFRYVCGAREFYDNYDLVRDGFGSVLDLQFKARIGDRWYLDFAPALKLADNDLSAHADDGSYVRVGWRPEGWSAAEGLGLAFFPLSSDRFRLGYSRRISWGGEETRIVATGHRSPYWMPALRLGLKRKSLDAFVGAKTHAVPNRLTGEPEQQVAALGGGGAEVLRGLRIDVNGGFFQRGANPRQDARGLPVWTAGGSLQLSYAVGEALPRSVDVTFADEDPTAPASFFSPPRIMPGTSWVVAAEGTLLGTSLQSQHPWNAHEATVQPAWAADLQIRVQRRGLRVGVVAMARSLSFVLLEVPSLIPYQEFPSGTHIAPDLLVAADAEYHLPSLRLVPSVRLGIERPASFGNPPQPRLTATPPQRLVFTGPYDNTILPACGDVGCPTRTRVGARLQARYDATRWLVLLASAHLQRDGNSVGLAKREGDPEAISERVFLNPWLWGLSLALAAGF